DAGSDLASLRTRAVRAGDGYVVNGQKVWSSYADQAAWCLLLARTDPAAAKHRGLSLFMLELDAPGVEVRPTRQATGTEECCQLFLTAVFVPAERLTGAENAGWRMAQTTLATERAFNILELQARLAVALGQIAAQALVTPVAAGRMAADDDSVRQELAARAAEIEVLGLLGRRLARQVEHTGDVGPEGSIVKLFYSETLQKLTRLAVRIGGM